MANKIKKTVFVLTTQIKFDLLYTPEVQKYAEERGFVAINPYEPALTDEAKRARQERWEAAFAPTHIICTTRLQLEKKIRKIQQYNIVDYCFTEIEIDSYAIPYQVQ